MERIAVIGAGSWGTAVAALAARENPVVLWARRPGLAAAINANAENLDYLPGFKLPTGLRATSDLAEATDGATIIAVGVPSHGLGEVVSALDVKDDTPMVSLTKGIEVDTLRRMTEVIRETRPGHDPTLIGVLTGPNLASEVIAGNPTAAVAALTGKARPYECRGYLAGPRFGSTPTTMSSGASWRGA